MSVVDLQHSHMPNLKKKENGVAIREKSSLFKAAALTSLVVQVHVEWESDLEILMCHTVTLCCKLSPVHQRSQTSEARKPT